MKIIMKRKFNPAILRHLTVVGKDQDAFKDLLLVKVAPTGIRRLSALSGILLVDVLNERLGTSLRVVGNRVGDTLSSGEPWRVYISGFNFVTGDVLLHGKLRTSLGGFVLTCFDDKFFYSKVPSKYQPVPNIALVAQGVTSSDITIDRIEGSQLQVGETLLSYTLALLADSLETADINLLLMVTNSIVNSVGKLTLSIDELERRQQLVVVPDFPSTNLTSHGLDSETGIPCGAQVTPGPNARVLSRGTSVSGVNFVVRLNNSDSSAVSVDSNLFAPINMLVIEGIPNDLSKITKYIKQN